MGKKYLIDSNIILEYTGGLLPPSVFNFVDNIIGESFNISVINPIEILGHQSVTSRIVVFIDLANQFELTSAIVEETIVIRKVVKIKLPDAIIAATAIVHDFVLMSRNTKDFNNIPGLSVINPHFG